jgi:hypothetical protein
MYVLACIGASPPGDLPAPAPTPTPNPHVSCLHRRQLGLASSWLATTCWEQRRRGARNGEPNQRRPRSCFTYHNHHHRRRRRRRHHHPAVGRGPGQRRRRAGLRSTTQRHLTDRVLCIKNAIDPFVLRLGRPSEMKELPPCATS